MPVGIRHHDRGWKGLAGVIDELLGDGVDKGSVSFAHVRHTDVDGAIRV